jgi:hypothetical protein
MDVGPPLPARTTPNVVRDGVVVGPGDGAGAVVRNAAASMSCDTSVSGNLWCWSYVSPNRTGNIDYLFPQKSGTLVYTRNNGASVDIF